MGGKRKRKVQTGQRVNTGKRGGELRGRREEEWREDEGAERSTHVNTGERERKGREEGRKGGRKEGRKRRQQICRLFIMFYKPTC